MTESTPDAPERDNVGVLRPLGRRASDTWHLLNDQQHTEIFSGGSAGPGKTFNMCLFEVTSALRYRGTAGGLFRDTAKSLRESTMVTFFEVCEKSRLRPGVDYTFKESKGLVNWAGGSVTYFDYLAFDPQDPNYSRLGGRAFTRCGIDEADQVEERAVDILMSRLRYKLTEFCHVCAADQMATRSVPVDCDDEGNPILWECYKCKTWTKGLLPKMLLTGNPGDYWTKYRFVFDKEGQQVKLKPHQARVLMLLDDNPDKAHVATYRRQLEKMDDFDRQRLLHGDWLVTRKTGREFLHAFDGRKHLDKTIPYNPELPLHITFDFNTAPYMTLLVAQIWQDATGKWRVHFLQEICLAHPYSNTEATCEAFLKELVSGRYKGHEKGVFYYGDASGKNKTTVVQSGIRHNYDIVEKVLRKYLHNQSDRVLRRNPSHSIVRDFCNAYLLGKLKLWVTFDSRMGNTTTDMMQVKEAADGGILKVMEKDRTTGVSAEKYGHCLQAHYYLTVGAFPDEFAHFIRK
jgi:hypothetical protein